MISLAPPAVQDLGELVFFFTFDLDRFWWWRKLTVDVVTPPG